MRSRVPIVLLILLLALLFCSSCGESSSQTSLTTHTTPTTTTTDSIEDDIIRAVDRELKYAAARSLKVSWVNVEVSRETTEKTENSDGSQIWNIKGTCKGKDDYGESTGRYKFEAVVEISSRYSANVKKFRSFL